MWTAATLIVAGVWVSSLWLYAYWVCSWACVELTGGAVVWSRPPRSFSGPAAGANMPDAIDRAQHWRDFRAPRFVPPGRGRAWVLSMPLWLLPLPMLIPTTRAWLSKPLSRSVCPRCGYDLAGLTADKAGKCPECGTPRSITPTSHER